MSEKEITMLDVVRYIKNYIDKRTNENYEKINKLECSINKMKNCLNCKHDYSYNPNICAKCFRYYYDYPPKIEIGECWEMKD